MTVFTFVMALIAIGVLLALAARLAAHDNPYW